MAGVGNSKPLDQRRKIINARLPQPVIDAIKRASDENGTSITDEIEARLVETLIADGLLDRITATRFCGAFTVASVQVR